MGNSQGYGNCIEYLFSTYNNIIYNSGTQSRDEGSTPPFPAIKILRIYNKIQAAYFYYDKILVSIYYLIA